MTTIYSPHNIEILLWCHVRCEPHPRLDAPAVRETLETFLSNNVVEPAGPDLYSTTAKGKAWVDALCNVPMPKAVFIDEMGRVLNSK